MHWLAEVHGFWDRRLKALGALLDAAATESEGSAMTD